MSKWILVLFVFALPAFACLWRTETNLDGHHVDINDFDPETYLARMRHEEDAEYWESQLSSLGATDSLEKRNDKAVALAHLGRCTEALAILQAMEILVGSARTPRSAMTLDRRSRPHCRLNCAIQRNRSGFSKRLNINLASVCRWPRVCLTTPEKEKRPPKLGVANPVEP